MSAARPLRRPVATFAALAIACLAWPVAAGAHAAFQDASPEPGARLGSAPAKITLAFTETLNQQLTTARIVGARSQRPFPARVVVEQGRRLLLVPRRPLPTGAYRVEWHTVSILDGHALEGSFGFGVRTSALGGEQQLEQSPLARGGAWRVGLRGVFYAALMFFGGGLLCALALSPRTRPDGWLLDQDAGRPVIEHRPALWRDDAVWRRTRVAGWLAAGASVGVALAETRDAAGSVSWRAIDAYLLSTSSGTARAVTVAAVVIAAVLAGRAWRVAAVAVLVALGAIAVGGHASSASPRWSALASDWVHLVAATVWAGGIAQLAVTWLPRRAKLALSERQRVMRVVFERFGLVALPAAGVVVAAGLVNALIELGRPAELWTSAYGRVVAVKMAVVGAMIVASYVHALRLRPRLLAERAPRVVDERRHWWLFGSEPALAAGAVLVAALLAAFPLPPRQLLERAEAGTESAPSGALRPPAPGELATAEQAGTWIAAAWSRPVVGGARATVRLFNFDVRPVHASIRVAGAAVTGCGIGCVTFVLRGDPATVRVLARAGRQRHSAVIPVRWRPRDNALARRILRSAVRASDAVRSMRIAESLRSGFAGNRADISAYRIASRFRFAITSRNGGPGATVVIGRRTWVRQPDGRWSLSTDAPVDRRELMPWWSHRDKSVRLLDVTATHDDIALTDLPRRGNDVVPFWFRLRIDRRTHRVLRMRMIAPGHFMTQRYYAFDAPLHVTPPRSRSHRHAGDGR